MLHTETVSDATLELLKRLMGDPLFRSYCLVGGTATALQLGHRISVDLDFFTPESIDTETVVRHLRETYGFVPAFIARNTIKGEIDGVKIDCITHPYPMVEPLVEADGVRLASLCDIAAMKLNAIVNSGERVKDFIDVAWLSHVFTLREMLDAYGRKYSVSSLIPLRALGYWDDIDFQEPVRMVSGRLDWRKVQKQLEWMMRNMDKKNPAF